jgi:hypothetical protein
MSQTFSYTFYIPVTQMVKFSILEKTLPAPQSQQNLLNQYTVQLQSTPDASTALGIGTESSIATFIVDQQGQINDIIEMFFNMNGSETGGDIPPKGVLAVVFSCQSKHVFEVPPGEEYIVVKGLINTLTCNGAYFGAVGTCVITEYADKTIPEKVVVTYTLPPL